MNISDVRFDCYYKYDELCALLNDYAEAYPNLVDLGVMGKSWEGRDVLYLSITNKETGPHNEKPAMYIDGNMHAGEVTGSMVCLYTIDYLTKNYGKDPDASWLLDTRAFYIAPRVNPDGAEKYLTTPHMLRSSVRPYPGDITPNTPGLHPADIDGDGHILTMRVRDDVKGEWKASSKDPRVMVPRKIDERTGAFYRLYNEGYIIGYDGEPFGVNPVPWGLDMNRNFPANWNPDAKQGGPYPASEPEVKNIVDFILAHPNIGALEAYHTTGGIIFRSPYVYPDEQMDRADYETMMQIVRRGTEITGYPDVSSYGQSTATIVDWAYEHRGIIGFCTELWDMAGRAGLSKMTDYASGKQPGWDEIESTQLALLAWNDRELSGAGFIDWYEAEHPQLGKVELGGWEPKFVRQNCPPKFLEQECHKNMLWSFAHCSALPDAKIGRVETQLVADNVYKVRVLIENSGYLPTNISNKAKQIKAACTVKACVALSKGARLIGGKPVVDLGHLDGYRQGQNPNLWGIMPPAKSAARAEWVVRCEPGANWLEVKVDAGRGGVDRKRIELG